MFAHIENNAFVRWVNLLEEYAHVSFPVGFPDECLPPNVVRVYAGEIPAHGTFEMLEAQDVPVFNGTRWCLQYNVRPMTEGERETQLANMREGLRETRNRILATSDWTQLADVPVDRAAWAAYRQALRDISTQPDFPVHVVWPVPPA